MALTIVYTADICEDCYMAAYGLSTDVRVLAPSGLSYMECIYVDPKYASICPQDEDGEAHFGKAPCDGCLTTDHGNRITVDVFHDI